MEWIAKLTQLRRAKIVSGLLALFALQTVSATAGNKLDDFESMCESKGSRVIDNYQVQNGVVYIGLNSEFWSGATKDYQLRLLNSLANIGILESMNVSLAVLTLDRGNTTVGQISHNLSGGSEFTPNDDYWKYR